MIAVFITIEFTGAKFAKDIECYVNIDEEGKKIELKSNKFKVCLAVLVFLGITLYYRDTYFAGMDLIFQGYLSDDLPNSELYGGARLLRSALSSWLVVLGVFYCRKRQIVTKKNRYIYMAVLLMILFIVSIFIGQTRISRWSTVYATAVMLYIAYIVFPKYFRLFKRMFYNGPAVKTTLKNF